MIQNGINIIDLRLRMLGYYNNPGQLLKEETENTEFAIELGRLLSISFENIDDVNRDQAFDDALQNGVFVLRDKASNLYAYWPKNKIARVSNVIYNKSDITILPLEYKCWFTPGESIQIGLIGASSTKEIETQTLIEHLKTTDSIGKNIKVIPNFSNGISYTGDLVAIGKDYLLIKDNNCNTIYFTTHFCLEFPSKAESINEVRRIFNEVDENLPTLGVITKLDRKGYGYIKTLNGKTLGLRKQELLEDVLKVGSEVIFSIRTEYHPNGKIMDQATSVHSTSSISSCLTLAKSLRDKGKLSDAKDVLQHILDVYPDNQEALIEQLKIPTKKSESTIVDEDTILFNSACELIVNPETAEKAIETFIDLLSRNKKAKDSISRILLGYYILYSNENDEDSKDIRRKQLYDFLKNNHSKLAPSASLNTRLNYFYKLDMDNEYLETIDSVLRDPQTEIAKRARMWYLKATYSLNKGREDEAISFARHSIYLSPFNNKAELMLPEFKYLSENLPTMVKSNNAINDIISIIPQNKDVKKPHIVSKEDDLYVDKLLYLAKNNNTSSSVEYISILAERISQNKDNLESAVYLWNILFNSMTCFGFFAQYNLSTMLARLLDVQIVKDISLESYAPWENRKTWQEVLGNAKSITKTQWYLIFLAINHNDFIINKLELYIASNERLKSNLYMAYDISSDEYQGLSLTIASVLIESAEKEACKKIIQAFGKKTKLLDQYTALSSINWKEDPFTTVNPINNKVIQRFTNFLELLQKYILETDPEERTKLSSYIFTSIDDQKKEISNSPTQLSVSCLAKCLDAIKISLSGVQNITRKSSLPDFSIQITNDNVLPDSDGKFHICANAVNAQGAINASNVRFEIQSKWIEECERPEIVYDTVTGGETVLLEYSIRLNDSVLSGASWGFAIKCSYLADRKQYSKVFTPLQVHLAQAASFVKIEKNPYTYGPALQYDDPTFYGRSDDIQFIIDAILHPQREGAQLIVYGQKRCGKSTLVEAVKSKIEKNYSSRAWCVYLTLRIDSNDNAQYSEASFYLNILKEIRMNLIAMDDNNKPSIKVPSEVEFLSTTSPTDLFSTSIMEFKQSMKQTAGWENRRLVLIIDEFTVLYNSIKKGTASEEVLHHWKGIQESNLTKFATIFVGHDITPTFFAEPYAKNATAIIEPYQLSYLDENAARNLIEKPISFEGESRFEEKAIKIILYYTACSPSYLQIYMQEMVDYINLHKIIKVSDIDAYNVAQRFITKQVDAFSSISGFDNLINSGLDDRFCKIKDAHFEHVLRAIARKSKGTDWCKYRDLESTLFSFKEQFSDNGITLNEILRDLEERKVIERKANNEQIKIKVGLFKEWLIRN